jgi:hypothetical protein
MDTATITEIARLGVLTIGTLAGVVLWQLLWPL